MDIPTWEDRCEGEHEGLLTPQRIQKKMEEEIDDLRAEIERLRGALISARAEFQYDTDYAKGWHDAIHWVSQQAAALSGKGG